MLLLPTVLTRSLALYLLWWVLAEGERSGFVFGAVAAALVALLSLRIFGASAWSLRPWRLLRFAGYFVGLSVVAGLDVARRLLTPSLPVNPGCCSLITSLPPGGPRWLLANTLSLLPGTLTVTLDGEQLKLHCLDSASPVEASVRRTEAAIARLFGLPPAAAGAATS
ncbi:Na+/H+ antiporter subunit E [Kineobactrum salinum]|uniref:Na+/H+ antiporter subunit E n=1 Tax=Kineobactrum salinum TaxID=2708301 RepID=A0A6C0TZF7_9GAMM|nr:Na+/H+ antiporter subunit E [Kineobactrum salinum]QIB65038.1 Na+/H+ antiporter subunit E [Kineobactrum salinum]